MLREPLSEWNLYHKCVLALLVAIVLSAIVKAVTAIEGGAYDVRASVMVAAPAEALWPWIIMPENRVRWEAELIDTGALQRTADQVESTRLLFWRTRGERWNALEITTEIAPGLLYRTYQESDRDTRSTVIRLEPQGACATQITLSNTIRHTAYRDRFWSFLNSARAEERLDASARALERWAGQLGGCDPDPKSLQSR